MLGMWISGAGAREMERETEEDALKKITSLMRKFAGKAYPNMQDPKKILVGLCVALHICVYYYIHFLAYKMAQRSLIQGHLLLHDS